MRQTDSDRLVSRRQYILSGATLAGGVGLFTLTSDRTQATVALDTLDVSGVDKSMSQPPSTATVAVGGSWEITGGTPEQSRVILQIEHANTSRDMAEHIEMDHPKSGDYSLEADLLNHPEIDGADLLPQAVGERKDTEIVVRIILLAIESGEIQNEIFAEDTAIIKLTREGMEMHVGGQGSVNVSA